MTELGKLLKEKRLAKGLSIEEIHQVTKIQKRYLEALEEGNLDSLPGHFYARAFAKSYAEAVGLDPDIVMEKVRTEAAPPPVEEENNNPPLRRGKPKVKVQIPTARWLSKAFPYLFAVLLLFVIYIAVSHYDKNPGKNAAKDTIHSPEAAGNVSKSGQAQPKTNPAKAAPAPKASVTPTVSLAFLNQQGNIYHYTLAGTKQFDITIKGKETCWLRVVKGGQNGTIVDEVTIQPNEAKHWLITDAKEAWVRMGNAPGVDVKINGQAVDTSKMARALQIIAVGLKQS